MERRRYFPSAVGTEEKTRWGTGTTALTHPLVGALLAVHLVVLRNLSGQYVLASFWCGDVFLFREIVCGFCFQRRAATVPIGGAGANAGKLGSRDSVPLAVAHLDTLVHRCSRGGPGGPREGGYHCCNLAEKQRPLFRRWFCSWRCLRSQERSRWRGAQLVCSVLGSVLPC